MAWYSYTKPGRHALNERFCERHVHCGRIGYKRLLLCTMRSPSKNQGYTAGVMEVVIEGWVI